MKEMVYTLAAWRVQEGRQQAFISAWKDLGEAFNSLSDPPGKGVLIQSTSDPTLFYSFVPWKSMEAVEAMRNDHHAREGIKRLEGLCTEATPGSFHVVAESPEAERTDKRIPTRVMWQCSILTSRSTRRRCASSEIRRFLASGSTRMFSRSRTVARVNGIALGAHLSRTVVQSQIAADSHLRAHFHY